MTTKITTIILCGLTALVFAVSVAVYAYLPETVASHWNAAGEADGFMPKFWGVFLFPLLMAGLFVLYYIIPVIDPLKTNIESFRKYYNAFWILLFIFFAYLFALSMFWNFQYRFNFTVAMIPAVALLLYALGVILEHAKRNWFVGIRTPWTLSDDGVWEKTHRLGARLFKIAALIALLGIFFRDSVFVVMFLAVPAGVIALVTVVYSYVVYRKVKP
ncbi:MAG: SdpI family protein [Patescibacteria group bacterium]